MSEKQVFVIAAEVAAELNKGMMIAKQLLLIASNARALALRAGESAAGFRPITDSIDHLVKTTLDTSKIINIKAQRLSRIATEGTRSASAIEHFQRVYVKASGASYLSSLDKVRKRNQKEFEALSTNFTKEARELHDILQSLYNELRIAQIISTMLSVEASQAHKNHHEQLNNIAHNVTELANLIQKHVQQSLTLFSQFTKVGYAIKRTI